MLLRAALSALVFLVGAAPLAGARADEALSARVRDVLAAHCPLCRTLNGPDAPLDLGTIARDPNLVRPGNPDGSPAYTTLLRRIGPNHSAPTPDELGALRTWIEGLPAEAATCPSATFVPRAQIEATLARHATKALKPTTAFRVLSLAHLDLGCATPEQLTAWRQAMELVLAAAAELPRPVPTHVLDAKGHALAFDIQELGWDANRWRTITGVPAGLRRSDEPLIVRADALAARVLRGDPGSKIADPAAVGEKKQRLPDDPEMSESDRVVARTLLSLAAAPDALDRNADLFVELARQHLAPLGLVRLSAELGLAREAVEKAMTPAASGATHLLLRLSYGTIARNEVEDNWPMLARLTRAPAPARALSLVPFGAVRPDITPETPIELALFPDRVRYAAGDPIRFTVRSNLDCYLTVISIDAAGYGTVIFPNDFVTSNRINAHLNVLLPETGAKYRFRLKEKGRERLVALCSKTDGAVDGIRHDFERQRFQELGPYAAFIDKALRQATDAGEEPSDRAERRPASRPVPQSRVWRTAIVVEVE